MVDKDRKVTINPQKLVGLKIVAMKTRPYKSKRKKNLEMEYVLFDDGKTIMQFEEQDYYSYHDCASYARTMTIMQNAELHKLLMETEPDSDMYF